MNFQEFLSNYQKREVEHYPNACPAKPLLSVCVQTYQHVDYIKECLDGILMQETNFSFEILLGEDHSVDGTREICIEYAEKYPEKIRLFLHQRENNISLGGNPSGRFNFLYNLFSARGNYIALCEGDDFWTDPKKLQKQVDLLESDPAYVICSHRTTRLNRGVYHEQKSLQKVDGSFEDIVQEGFLQDTLSVVFRNNLESLPDWLTQAHMADYPLYILLTEGGGKARYLDEVMGCYRIHEGSIWSSLSKEQTGLKCIRSMEIIDQGTQQVYHELFKKAIAHHKRKFGLFQYSLAEVIKGELPLKWYLQKLKTSISES